MQAVADRRELVKALTTAGKAISRRNTLPVLSGVRITANGRLEVAASDLELTIAAELDCVTGADGAVVAPSRDLLALVKSQRADTVRLEETDGYLSVNGARVRLMAADDYPSLPGDAPAGESWDWDAQDLKAALERVIPAASTDESRQILTGVLFDGEAGEFAATDSYRLAVASFPYGNPGGQYVIPARVLKRVVAAIGKRTERVTATFAGQLLTFTIGDVSIRTRLIEGQYVNYRQLIPDGPPNVLEADKGKFLEALAQVSPMAQNNLPVTLELGAAEGGRVGVEITASTPDVGEAAAWFPAGYNGAPLKIAFNPDFLKQGLKAMPAVTGTIRLELVDQLKPAKFHENYRGGHFTYLLMPVRLS